MELVKKYLELVSPVGITQISRIRCSFIDFHNQYGLADGEFELEFSEDDIYRAALTVGKGNYERIFGIPHYSWYEIEFRINMIKAFLNFESQYIKRSEAFHLLDPSEKGAINYFLGMVFSNLVATSRLKVIWLIHLDSYDKTKLEFKLENNKKPDFIGITSDDKRIVLESKGWMNKKKSGISNALQQLRTILSVEGEQNILKVASILYEKKNELYMDVIDPKEKELIQVSAGNSDYLKDYYARIFLILLNTTESETIDNCSFITRKVQCGSLKVGLLQDVYDIIYQSTNNDNGEEHITEKIKRLIFKRKQDFQDIKEKYKLSVGLDGIYVMKLN